MEREKDGNEHFVLKEDAEFMLRLERKNKNAYYYLQVIPEEVEHRKVEVVHFLQQDDEMLSQLWHDLLLEIHLMLFQESIINNNNNNTME